MYFENLPPPRIHDFVNHIRVCFFSFFSTGFTCTRVHFIPSLLDHSVHCIAHCEGEAHESYAYSYPYIQPATCIDIYIF